MVILHNSKMDGVLSLLNCPHIPSSAIETEMKRKELLKTSKYDISCFFLKLSVISEACQAGEG